MSTKSNHLTGLTTTKCLADSIIGCAKVLQRTKIEFDENICFGERYPRLPKQPQCIFFF